MKKRKTKERKMYKDKTAEIKEKEKRNYRTVTSDFLLLRL